MDLKRQIQSATKGNLTCSDYLQSIKRVADELACVGSPYPEDELVMAAINGLGSDYLPVVAAVNAASVHSPFSFSDLHTLLLGHEALLKSNMTPAAAFYAGRGGHGRARAPYQHPSSTAIRPGNPTSFFPRAPPRPNFPTNTNGPSSQSSSTNVKPTCQICVKLGHEANVCYRRYDPDPNWRPNPRFHAYTAQTQINSAAPTDWIIDSGANNHVTSDINNLSSFFAYDGGDKLQIGNGIGLSIHHIGSTSFSISNHSIKLCDVLHVPHFSTNLISLSKLLHDNPSLEINFTFSHCLIKDLHTKTLLLRVHSSNGLFILNFKHSPQAFLTNRITTNVWHARLGHPSNATTLEVVNSNKLPCIRDKLSLCHNCAQAKAHVLPFSPSTSTSTFPLQLVHSDV